MGLDMYLQKVTWIGNRYKSPEEQTPIDVLNIQQSRVDEIIEGVGYWRKANAIHSWFVKNVQNGNDTGDIYCVSKEQLQALLGVVEQILATKHDGEINLSTAEKLLPTQEGFFFGSTEYDQGYVEDLELTKKILDVVLKEFDQKTIDEIWDLRYHASW